MSDTVNLPPLGENTIFTSSVIQLINFMAFLDQDVSTSKCTNLLRLFLAEDKAVTQTEALRREQDEIE